MLSFPLTHRIIVLQWQRFRGQSGSRHCHNASHNGPPLWLFSCLVSAIGVVRGRKCVTILLKSTRAYQKIICIDKHVLFTCKWCKLRQNLTPGNAYTYKLITISMEFCFSINPFEIYFLSIQNDFLLWSLPFTLGLLLIP